MEMRRAIRGVRRAFPEPAPARTSNGRLSGGRHRAALSEGSAMLAVVSGSSEV